MFLGDVFEVRSGLVVSRKKALNEVSAKYKYNQLNLRCISKDAYIKKKELEVLRADEVIASEYITTEGDVVVRLTDPYTAVYINKEDEGLVITSNFAIIKNTSDYDTRFLAFYLNGDYAKKKLYANMQGSIVKSINLFALEKLDLPSIPYNQQIVYGKLFSVITNKISMLEEIKELEQKLQKRLVEQISNK